MNFWKKKKSVLIALLLVGCAYFCLHGHVETVEQHNRRIQEELQERQALLAELNTTGETTGKQQTTAAFVVPETASQEVSAGETGEDSNEEQTTQNMTQEESGAKQDAQTQSFAGEQLATERGSSQTATTVKTSEGSEAGSNLATGGETNTTGKMDTTKPQKTEATKPQKTETTSQQTTTESVEYRIVSIQIVCQSVIGNPDLKTDAKLPADGILLTETKIPIKKGETVADVLSYACNAYQISYQDRGSSYGAYIYAIGGLEEKQCGKFSGWKYKVNGEVISYACSSCELEENDRIVWYYATNYME